MKEKEAKKHERIKAASVLLESLISTSIFLPQMQRQMSLQKGLSKSMELLVIRNPTLSVPTIMDAMETSV